MPKPSVIGVALLAGVVLYWLGSCRGKSVVRDEAALERAHAILQATQPYRDSLRVLGRHEHEFQDSIRQLRIQFHRQGDTLSALNTQLQHAGTVRDSLRITLRETVVLRGQVDALQQENLDLQTAMNLVTAQRDLAEDRVDSLEAHLKETLTVASCHWDLGLIHPPCPSRGTVGVLAAVGGLAVGYWAANR